MPVHERRQHFRIDDRMYFNYRILAPGEFCSDSAIISQLLGEQGKKFMEAAQYLQDIDNQLSEHTQDLAIDNPGLAHCLNLLNSKIDYLTRHILMSSDVEIRKVNVSLGGMAFKTPCLVKVDTQVKVVIYTKPKLIPIILDGKVVYSQFQSAGNYRTSLQFEGLNPEQEQLLAQHILLVQIKDRSN